MSLSPPVVVYPNAVTTQHTSHSKGSFGPVFAVLAVVIVLAAIACLIGQLCSRRFSHPKQQPRRDSHPKQPRGDRNFHHEEGDLEFGFKTRMPTGKPAGDGETRGPKPAGNGKNKGETKFAEEAKKQVHAEE